MNKFSIKISIITVVYNGVQQIEETIKSVISQSYKNLEYIIIDGGSNDGTLDKIKKYDKYISKFISEPDNGIYDAMNKGVDLVSGDWVNFMNCGDYFFNENVLNEIFADPKNISNSDVIYGNTIYRYKDFNVIDRSYRGVESIWKNMIFSHQSSFVKRELLQENKFDISYRFASDFNFFFNLYLSGHAFSYVDKIISSNYAVDGKTLKNHISSIIERKRIVYAKTPKLKYLLFYNLLILRQMLYSFMRFILNERVINLLLIFKNSYINRGRQIS